MARLVLPRGEGVAVAAAVTLPFALWNLPAYWKSVVRVQLVGPFRWDALSYLVWWGFHGHGATQPSTAFLCSIIALSRGAGALPMASTAEPSGVFGLIRVCFTVIPGV